MLTVTRRDDKVFTLYFYENGSAMDLAGCELLATVKQNIEDTDSQARILSKLEITIPTTLGIASWTVSRNDTQYMIGQYFCDIQLKDALGMISTILSTTFEVCSDVTIRTSV